MGSYYRKNKSKFNNPKEKKKRAKRNAARRAMVKKHGKAALRGKDVDHKRPLSKGGGNGMSNLRIATRKANRGRK